MRTLIQGKELGSSEELENILITHNEEAKIVQDDFTTISYGRMNHIPFSYEISIDNPKKIKKKVIVRLWLGLSSNDSDVG